MSTGTLGSPHGARPTAHSAAPFVQVRKKLWASCRVPLTAAACGMGTAILTFLTVQVYSS